EPAAEPDAGRSPIFGWPRSPIRRRTQQPAAVAGAGVAGDGVSTGALTGGAATAGAMAGGAATGGPAAAATNGAFANGSATNGAPRTASPLVGGGGRPAGPHWGALPPTGGAAGRETRRGARARAGPGVGGDEPPPAAATAVIEEASPAALATAVV